MLEAAEQQGRRRRRLTTVSLLVVAVSVGVAIFLPEAVSLAWHLTHGTRADFRGVTMSVPLGWWAFERENSLIIQKMGHTLLGEPHAQDMILRPLDLPGDSVADDEKLKAAKIAIQRGQGYAFIAERQFPVGQEDSYCDYFHKLDDNQNLRITCDVPSLKLSVDFFGDASYAPALERALGTIRRR